MYDRIPGTPTWPLLVVTTVSWSPELEWRRGRALMQADCWGSGGDPTSTAVAGTLARTVVSVIPDLKGAWPPAGTVESAAFDLLLPQPDTTTGRARVLVQFQITTAAEGT